MKAKHLHVYSFVAAIVSALLLCAVSVSCATGSAYTPPAKNVTVSLGTSSLTMVSGRSHTFSPTFKNTDTAPELIWTSSDESILKVDSDGTITAFNTTDRTVSATVTAALADNPNMRSVCTVAVLPGNSIHFLTAAPGQDASTQVIISWHCPAPTCRLEYTDGYGSDMVNGIDLEGTPTVSEWADLDTIFRYELTLSGLVPGADYSYRVVTPDGNSSAAQSFRTAGGDGCFAFAWMSDIHASTAASMQNFSELLGCAQSSFDVSFCLFTGDMVNQGKRYIYWDSWTDSGMLAPMSYAFVIGNHEYYPNNSLPSATASYYLDFTPIPDNHGSSPAADWWFIYDGVLFICLDSMASDYERAAGHSDETNPALQAQAKWFAEVVEQNEGAFRYLIVAQHFAFLDSEEEGTGFYSFWYPVFDKYAVDLALSSDSHMYSRSKTLYGDSEAEVGTVYITSPMAEGKELDEIICNRPTGGRRCAAESTSKVKGGCVITVTPQDLTFHLIGRDGLEYDGVTIPCKR